MSFQLTLDSPLVAFVSGGTWAANLTSTFTGITIEDIKFHATIIHRKVQVMQQITQPMYSIPTEAFNCLNVYGLLLHNNNNYYRLDMLV